MFRSLQTLTAACGLLSITVFVCSFLLFGLIHPDFDLFGDFISKLGGKDQPNAIGWNTVGFGGVGLLLAAFGWLFGLCRNDRVLGMCLMVAGLGFSLAAIPTDFAEPQSTRSAAHFVSICLSLAGFCFGMARLTGSRSTRDDRVTANWVVTLSILAIACVSCGVLTEPVAHRMILIVVFCWVGFSSLRLLKSDVSAEIVE